MQDVAVLFLSALTATTAGGTSRDARDYVARDYVARHTSHVSTSHVGTSHVGTSHVARGTSHVGTSHVARGTSHVAGGSASLRRFEFQQSHMGTAARVVLFAAGEARARAAADRAFARIAELDARLSDYRDDSELMQLCAKAGGQEQPVSDDLARVLHAAQELARRTGGAFDVTIGPVSRLWRRARASGTLPDAAELAAAKQRVGYEHLTVSPERRTVRLARPGMMLDLGGIGKGFAADEALAVLRESGAPIALVSLGGDVAAGDPPPAKSGWEIAIEPLGPRVRAQVPLRVLRNAGISTSGDAEQFLERAGVRHSHVVDPASGSARTGRRGITVVAPTTTESDGLSTAVGVLGAERGLRLVDQTPGAAALFVELTPSGVVTSQSRRW
jgi:thiamine biosynthesis lipoprotein